MTCLNGIPALDPFSHFLNVPFRQAVIIEVAKFTVHPAVLLFKRFEMLPFELRLDVLREYVAEHVLENGHPAIQRHITA